MNELNRKILIYFIDNQNIEQKNISKALKELEIIPSSRAWFNFINKVLLWFGALSIVFAILFFIAYNWSELGRFGKFALVEGVLIASIVSYLYIKDNELLSKVVLMVSAMLVGIVLALIGQAYQIGADSWELFFYWAVLILPWVFISRFLVMWMFWIGLIDISIILYMNTFDRFLLLYSFEFSFLWILFIFNTLALILLEYLKSSFSWLDSFWAIAIIGFISTIVVTILMFEDEKGVSFPIWIVWILMIYYLYRVRSVNIFMLLLGFGSFSIVLLYYIINFINFRYFNPLYIFFISFIILGLGSSFLYWIKSIEREIENESK